MLWNLINLCFQSSWQKLHWKLFGKAKEASKCCYLPSLAWLSPILIPRGQSGSFLHAILAQKYPNQILQFYAGELLKPTICQPSGMQGWCLQHQQVASANARRQVGPSCAWNRDAHLAWEFYSTPRITFRKNHSVLSRQKPFKDLFNFLLMLSSSFLFSLRSTWKCL